TGNYGPSLSVPTGSLSLGAHTAGVAVSGLCGSVTNSATLTVQEPTSASGLSNATVCTGTDANFSTTASGTGPFNYAWTLDDASTGTNDPGLTVITGSLTTGTHTVRLIVTGQCGSATNSAILTVNAITSATDLTDSTLCQGANANFSTAASGTGPFTYAWTLNGTPIGTDIPSLTVATGTLNIGNHTVAVVVSGQCGSVTQSATLTVSAPTSATVLSDTTVCNGTDANFSTTAGGPGPFTYAWTVDGIAGGSNSPNLTLATGTLTVGSHTVVVVVSGQCGSVTQNATLTVNALTIATNI